MITLSTYITNQHFARLFAAAEKPCAIQLWVLIAKNPTGSVVKTVIYGRVLPYFFANHRWSFSNNDKYQEIEGENVKLTRLNLFTSSQNTKAFFEHFCNGQTLKKISQQLGLGVDEPFNKAFGDIVLNPAELILQPVEYLLNKSAYEQNALHSPHESAGALSAAIVQTNKLHLISESSNQKNSLLSHIAETLNAETGLDFLGSDQERLGNIEFLVFPSLDDKERAKLTINPRREKQAIKVELAAEEQKNVSYQLLIKLFNLHKLIYSTLQIASYCKIKQAYTAEFLLDAINNEIYDCIEVETYLSKEGKSFELQDRWRMSYIRKISSNLRVIGAGHQPVKLDWLENKVQSKYSDRAQALLTPNESNSETITINSRKNERWVELNQQFSEKFNLLKPQASKGKFFLRYGLSQGEGALEFIGWIKKLFNQYQNHHVAIFDPYFETLGLNLLKLYGTTKSNYSVFTSYPKKKDEKKREQSRYNTLLQLCEQNLKLFSRLNLTIYGLKQGELHDRYILVLNNENIPVQGFQLSNSLQSATVNHPLLITPIPQDVLLEVSAYMRSLIQKSGNQANTEAGIKTLFDSQQPIAGNQKIRQQAIKQEDDGSHNNMTSKEIMSWVDVVTGPSEFKTEWLKVATSLANISNSFSLPDNLPSNFVDQLEAFLNQTAQRPETEHETVLSITAPSFYATKIDQLLNLNIELVLRHSYSKASNLNWAEYYAIKLLWQHRPKVLFDLITAEGKKKVSENLRVDASNAKHYTLLSQALSVMHLSTILAPTDEKAQQLLDNDNAVLQWFGLNMLNQLVSKTSNPEVFFAVIQDFSQNKQITFAGWLLLQQREQACEGPLRKSIDKFLQLLPSTLNKRDLKTLLDSLRGHMKNLAHNGAWIHQNILQPLLEQNRVHIDDVALFWLNDLKSILPLCNSSGSALFSNDREGKLTSLAAYFFTFASAKQQAKALDEIKDLLSQAQRTLHQPLASTVNYKLWNAAIFTGLWLDAFLNLARFYHSQTKDKAISQLEKIQTELAQIIQLRSNAEWQQFANEMVEFHAQTKAMLLSH